MKKIFKYALVAIAGIALISACTEGISYSDGDQGLRLRLSPSADELKILSYGSQDIDAIAAMADIANFRITLTNNETGAVAYVWERYSDMPPVVEIAKGSYTIVAESGDVKLAGFDGGSGTEARKGTRHIDLCQKR